MSDYSWLADAACKGAPDHLFFPERGGDTRVARAMCNSCPVREQCLRDAIENYTDHDDHGIRGGLSARQRAHIRRAKARAQRSAA